MNHGVVNAVKMHDVYTHRYVYVFVSIHIYIYTYKYMCVCAYLIVIAVTLGRYDAFVLAFVGSAFVLSFASLVHR